MDTPLPFILLQALCSESQLFVTEHVILQYLGLISNNMHNIESNKYKNEPKERKLFYQVGTGLLGLNIFQILIGNWINPQIYLITSIHITITYIIGYCRPSRRLCLNYNLNLCIWSLDLFQWLLVVRSERTKIYFCA